MNLNRPRTSWIPQVLGPALFGFAVGLLFQDGKPVWVASLLGVALLFGIWWVIAWKRSHAETIKDMRETLQDIQSKHVEQEKDLDQVRGEAAIAQSTQMLAHDVRKPFSLLKMALDQLSREKDPVAMRDIVRRFVPAVEKALDSADRMIADVMEFGHDTDLHLEAVAPDALIESTVNSLFRVKRDTNITLEYDFGHTHKVKADSLKVLRVLQNIVENAVEAMGGTGKIWFRTWQKEGEPCVFFEVGNDGSPIPPTNLARLFEPFWTKGKKGGTGLGLSITQKILDAHGAEITCTSDAERGTIFTFGLPLSDDKIEKMISDLPPVSGEIFFRFEAAKKTGLGDVEPRSGSDTDLHARIKKKVRRTQKRLRVLLIDDHPLYMTGLNAQLMRIDGLEDIECSMASTGREAVDAAREERPHLIICDVDMGPTSIDGYEIVRKIRKAGLESLICMHSNHKSPNEFETAKRAGADGFLPKPMGEDSLLKLLLAALPDEAGKPSGRKLGSIARSLAEIALVDDCPFTLETWEQKLSGVRAHCFQSPDDFWRKLEEDEKFLSRLACVITDYYFDGEDITGGDFARSLRKRSDALPILLASDAQVENTAIDHVVGKLPVEWPELNKIIMDIRSRRT